MVKTTCFAQQWPSSGFSSEMFVCCKSVYIKHAAAYRCWDFIIEDFEWNVAYSLGMEPNDVGSEQVGGGGNLLIAHVIRLHTQAISDYALLWMSRTLGSFPGDLRPVHVCYMLCEGRNFLMDWSIIEQTYWASSRLSKLEISTLSNKMAVGNWFRKKAIAEAEANIVPEEHVC